MDDEDKNSVCYGEESKAAHADLWQPERIHIVAGIIGEVGFWRIFILGERLSAPTGVIELKMK